MSSNSNPPSALPPSGSAGGDLGGTYPNPTVNATHSGSAHHAAFVQADHDALANPHHSNANDHVNSEAAHSWHTAHQAHPDLATHDGLGLATDAELATHAAAADPHTVYLKETDFDDIDFLVGTATGHTGAEIVVGTSPGGELGGTWASPTVDASHSGSTHAATQAAAEATASAADAAHVAAADPHTGYQKESEKGAANGYASLGATTKVPIAELPTGTTSTTVSLGDHTHAGGSVALYQAEVDFGATPVSEASFTITNAAVTATSIISGSVAYVAPTGKDLDELDMDGLDLKFAPGTGELTLYARGLDGYIADKFKINYVVG